MLLKSKTLYLADCQSTRTLYQLVPSQVVPKSMAGPSQLKDSRTAVPTGNVFKSHNRNTETLTLTLTLTVSNAEGSDMGRVDLVRVGIGYELTVILKH